jgi:hypothetical protein
MIWMSICLSDMILLNANSYAKICKMKASLPRMIATMGRQVIQRLLSTFSSMS